MLPVKPCSTSPRPQETTPLRLYSGAGPQKLRAADLLRAYARRDAGVDRWRSNRQVRVRLKSEYLAGGQASRMRISSCLRVEMARVCLPRKEDTCQIARHYNIIRYQRRFFFPVFGLARASALLRCAGRGGGGESLRGRQRQQVSGTKVESPRTTVLRTLLKT